MPKINIHPLQSNSRHSGNRLVRYDSHPARYDNRPVLPDNRPPPGHSFSDNCPALFGRFVFDNRSAADNLRHKRLFLQLQGWG